MSQRDNILDIIKGIGILLVVFAHTHIGLINHYIYLFHMPLFFIVSGCMYAIGKGGTIKGKAKSLLIPYFVFSFFSFAYWWLVESKFRPMPTIGVFGDSFCGIGVVGQQFLNIFLSCNGEKAFIYNVALWFLPCLFIAHVFRNKLNSSILSVSGGVLAAIYYKTLWNINFAILF